MAGTDERHLALYAASQRQFHRWLWRAKAEAMVPVRRWLELLAGTGVTPPPV